MGTLANVRDNFKGSKIGRMLGDVVGLLSTMVNSEGYEDQTIEEAAKEVVMKNPEMSGAIEKTIEAISYEEEKRAKQAEKQFNSKDTFGTELDADGYKKIPDNVTENIKAKVSEEEALKQKSERQKDGRQKTRVDED